MHEVKYLVRINFGSFVFVVFNVATSKFLMIYVVLIALLDTTMSSTHGEGPRNVPRALLQPYSIS